MGLRIQNNVEAFNAHRQLTGPAGKAAKAMDTLALSSITFSTTLATGGLSEVLALSAGASGFSAVTLTDLDAAIGNVSTKRADFGAVQNRLEHRLNNLSTYQENLVASESRIRD